MGIRKGRLLMVCVATIVIGIALWFAFFNEDNGPKAEAAPSEPVQVYPERGAPPNIVKTDKSVACDNKTVASIVLADDEGTVSHNGTLITSTWDAESVLITFEGDVPYASGYVVGARSSEPFTIPSIAQGKNSPGIALDTTDFSKSGQFLDIYLCGGGM